MFNLNYVLELLAYFSFNLFFILKVVAVSGVDLDSIQEKLKIEAHWRLKVNTFGGRKKSTS